MNQTMPSNGNGTIPQEQAGASTMTEGLSVGHWLSRRAAAQDNVIARAVRDAREENKPPPSETELAHEEKTQETGKERAQAEIESDATFKKIDESLKIMSRWLNSSERMQAETNRAMNKAASEIHAAVRDQVQAFQHLTERISHVEKNGETALHNAMSGVRQELAHIVDRTSKAAGDNASQIGALAGNLERLADKIVSARKELQQHAQSSDGRFNALGHALSEVDEHGKCLESAVESIRLRLSTIVKIEEDVANLQAKASASERFHDNIVARFEESVSANARLGETVAWLEKRMASLASLEDKVLRLQNDVASQAGLADAVAKLEDRMTDRAKAEEELAAKLQVSFAAYANLEDGVSVLQRDIASCAGLEQTIAGLDERMTLNINSIVAKLKGSFASQTRLESSIAELQQSVAGNGSLASAHATLAATVTALEESMSENAKVMSSLLAKLQENATAHARLDGAVARLEDRLSARARVEDRILEALKNGADADARLDRVERTLRSGALDSEVNPIPHRPMGKAPGKQLTLASV